MEMKVEYRILGQSGVRVSNMCFGGNTFGQKASSVSDIRPGNVSEEEAHDLLDRFASLGGNFIDTSDIYTSGESEKIIGTWLKKQPRQKYIVATKCGLFQRDPQFAPNNSGLSRKHIIDSLEESLKRLRTDYIDLYQIHVYDYQTSLEETLSTLNDLVHIGKIRYIGFSNVSGWQLQKAVDITKHRGFAPITSLQAEYSLLERGVELELIEVCQNEGIGLLAYGPLKSGWLSGKIKPGMTSAPEGSRVAWATDTSNEWWPSNPTFQEYDCRKTWKILETLENISTETGKTVAQVALRWLLQRDCVTSLVFGSKTRDQLDANMEASKGWLLDTKQMNRLTEASKLQLFPPYNFIQLLRNKMQ